MCVCVCVYSMQSQSKSQHAFFSDSKLILEFKWKCKDPGRAKTSLEKNRVEELTVHDFKKYYKAMLFKTPWYWHNGRQNDQWYRVECACVKNSRRIYKKLMAFIIFLQVGSWLDEEQEGELFTVYIFNV